MSKTNLVFFKILSESNEFPPVIVENKTFKQVQNTKFLEVFVNENLNCKIPKNLLSRKLPKVSGILYRVRSQLTKKALLS